MLAGAVRQIASLGHVAPDHLTFPAAAIEGNAGVEFPGTKAAEEASALWACWRRCGSAFFCRCFVVSRMLRGQRPVSSAIFHEGVGLLTP